MKIAGFATGGGLDTHLAAKGDVRLAGLDGLRAIAVIAVMLFHADLNWARGGYLGVDLFFVISGFLITGLLVAESEATGRLNLGQFYWRRAKRLLPASWLMTIAATVAAALLAPDALPRLRGDALASFFYMTNWEMLWVNTSYFEAMGRPAMLQHLWSLAIEEQFYIFWAPVILFGLPRLGRRGLALLAALLAASSVVWMAVLAAKIGWPEQGNGTRLYFGTDTHGFPLLIGAVLGLVWRPNGKPRPANPAEGEGVFLAGLGALAAMAVLMGFLGEETLWLYPWGFLLSAAASCVLIACATSHSAAFGRWLDWAPMRWIGERSYGIYLWHWPIFVLTRPDLDLRLDATEILVLRFALTIGISALSYRFVEQPIRHGALDRIWQSLKRQEERTHAMRRAAVLGLSAGAALVAVAAILIFAPASPPVGNSLGLEAAASVPHVALKPVIVPVVVPKPDEPAVETFTGKDLTAVGDSVLLGSSALLKATLTGTQVYATMGWQTSDVLNQIKALIKAGTLTPVVLVHLGTNGYIYESQLRAILSLLADRKRVILINTHVPRRWMESNNALIDRLVPDYPNVVLVNWRDVSDGQPDYFIADGVHLTDLGQRAFITEIMRVGNLVTGPVTAPSADIVDPTRSYASGSGDLSPTLVRIPQPAASDAYWRRMARCETGANWQNAGRYSGGLGIFVDNWKNWGGLDYAPTPAAATQAQQIEIANRISTQGWQKPDGGRVPPIGFSSWRCLSAVGHPRTASRFTFTAESVLAQRFHLGEHGDVVRDLELMLGLPSDGVYGKRVRQRHLALLKTKGLPAELAGSQS